LLFLFKLPNVSRRFLITLLIAQVLVTLASRISIRLGLGVLRDRGHNTRYMLVVGTGIEAQRFADRVERHRELGLRVIGHLALDTPADGTGSPMVGRRSILGTVDDIEMILHGRVVDEVAICLPPEHVAFVEPITRKIVRREIPKRPASSSTGTPVRRSWTICRSRVSLSRARRPPGSS